MSDRVDLRKLLLGKQAELTGKLGLGDVHWHPTTKGDVVETDWKNVLDGRNGTGFLPARYAVSSAFVIDSRGSCSDQIDLVIYDAHYSPLLFEDGGHRYIPAESVYGVFEVKPELNRDYVLYAADKAASVRSLHRTSAPFAWLQGTSDPHEPGPILAGILTTRSGWTDAFGQPFADALGAAPADGRLDLGAVAADGAFEVSYEDGVHVSTNQQDEAWLMYFLTRLYTRLQKLKTVPAVDLAAYTTVITDPG